MIHAVAIRQADLGDVESIAAIHVASWQATYRGSMPDAYLDLLTIEQRLPMWEQILASPTTPIRVWVAEHDDEIVGFCSVGPPLSDTDDPGDSLVLHTIYLRPGHERQGIGGALLHHAEGGMRHLGASWATLWVLADNDGARRFYEAAGWDCDDVEKIDQLFGQTVREVRYSKRLA